MSEFSSEIIAQYRQAHIEGDSERLYKKLHVVANFMAYLSRTPSAEEPDNAKENHLNKPYLNQTALKLLDDEKLWLVASAIVRTDLMLDPFPSYSPPTIEQTQTALSCAYNLCNADDLRGQEMRGYVREAAKVLGLEVKDDTSILDRDGTFVDIQAILDKFQIETDAEPRIKNRGL
jgi:hypothetical protein